MVQLGLEHVVPPVTLQNAVTQTPRRHRLHGFATSTDLCPLYKSPSVLALQRPPRWVGLELKVQVSVHSCLVRPVQSRPSRSDVQGWRPDLLGLGGGVGWRIWTRHGLGVAEMQAHDPARLSLRLRFGGGLTDLAASAPPLD